MQTDAMNAGVAPGGLKSRIEIRVLICYILVNSDLPVPLEAVKEQLHFRGIANYFETAYAIADLTDNGTITEDINDSGIKLYSPTDEAKRSQALCPQVCRFRSRKRLLPLQETPSIVSDMKEKTRYWLKRRKTDFTSHARSWKKRHRSGQHKAARTRR